MENRMKNDRSLQGRFVLRVPVLFGAPPVLLFLNILFRVFLKFLTVFVNIFSPAQRMRVLHNRHYVVFRKSGGLYQKMEGKR